MEINPEIVSKYTALSLLEYYTTAQMIQYSVATIQQVMELQNE